MPTFEISTPSGETYHVDAPDHGAALQALGLGQSGPQAGADASAGDLPPLTIHRSDPKPSPDAQQPAGGPSYGDYAKDALRTIPDGLARGIAGTIGAPIDIPQMIESGARAAQRAITGQTPDEQDAFLREHALGYGLKDYIPKINVGQTLSDAVGATYQPKYLPGQYVNTLAEFAPAALGGGGGAASRLASVVIPALASETAGQAAKGTEMEPFARFGGALLGSGGAAGAGRLTSPTTPLSELSSGARNYAKQISPADVLDRRVAELQKLGPDATLADVSPEWNMVARGAAARPGSRDMVVDALTKRDEGKNPRLAADLDSSLGSAESPVAKSAEIAGVQKAVTDPLFKDAYQHGQLWNPALDELSQRPAVAQALRAAGDIAANQGRPLPTILLDEAGKQATPAARAAADQFAQNARPTLDRAVTDLLGDGGQLATADGIIARRSAEASPLYEAARGASIPDGAIPVDLLRRLKAAGAMPQAIQKMRIQGEPFDIGRVQSWDYMKRALDDKIGAATRKGANDDARIYKGLKQELTQAVDAAVPEWAQARQTFAGHSELLDALDAGQSAFKNNVSREALHHEYSALTDGEKAMYRLGAANTLREKLAQAGDNANLGNILAGNQALRDKLAVLAPNRAAADQFNAVLSNSGREFQEATRPDVRGWKYALDHISNRAAAAEGDQAQGLLTARDDLAGQLRQIPSMAKGLQHETEYKRLQDALGQGGKMFATGRDNVMRPGDLSASWANMTPAEREAFRVGARADLSRAVGTNANDPLALQRLVKGDGDWSRQNLQQVFGPKADDALNAIDRETRFNKTFNRVVNGTDTEATRGFGNFMDQTEGRGSGQLPQSIMGVGSKVVQNIWSLMKNQIGVAKANKYASELGRMAVSGGVERDQFIQALREAGVNEPNIMHALAMATNGGLISAQSAQNRK